MPGRLSLDRERCWVDVWALEHLLDRADRAAGSAERVQIAGRVKALYGGRFLAGEPHAPWAAPLADRLERRVRRLLGTHAP
jgi:hypothetical protein